MNTGPRRAADPTDKFDGVAHQLCTAHILRDLEDAAQAYPDAIWPGQAADALRALIHQANLARDQGLDAVPADRTAKDLKLFRHGVNVGLSQVPRAPGANEKQPPARLLLECLKHREADVLRFLSDTAIPPTNNQADYAEFGVMRTPALDVLARGRARPGEGGITAWWSETFEEGQQGVRWLVASGGDAGRAGEREGAFLGLHVGVDVDLG